MCQRSITTGQTNSIMVTNDKGRLSKDEIERMSEGLKQIAS
jgi:molecular chaperone DnaK (HSP70)